MRDKAADIGNTDEIEINLFRLLHDVLGELRRKAPVLLAIIGITGVIFYMAAGFYYSPVYAASSSFTVNKASSANYSTGSEKNTVSNRMGLWFPSILCSNALKTLVMDDLGYDSDTEFPATISATVVKETNLITLKVTADDPQLAYDVLQSLFRNYAYISEPAIGELRLNIISESGVPGRPANSAGGKKAATTGVLLAIIVSLICLTVKCVLRKTANNSRDLAHYLGAEYLGSIPKIKAGKGTPVTIDTEGVSPALVESVRQIRHRIEKEAQENNVKTVLVTSAVKSEGKTTAAANLAIALANHRNKVLLVEGNLWNPSVITALGMPQAGKGISELLAGSCKTEDVTVPYRSNPNLTVIPGGEFDGVPAELWSSSAAEQLFSDVREQYDLVLIDAPQSIAISDTGLLARFSDAYVYVVQKNHAEIDTLKEGAGVLSIAGCKSMGCILNNKN